MTVDTQLRPTEGRERQTKSLTRHLPTVGRIVMGLIFFVCGLNVFLNFLPQPKTPMPAEAAAFAGALVKTGYLFRLIGGTEVIVGALLLTNRFVPLALALIAPVVVNIFAFHAFLAPSGIGLAVIVVAIEAYLTWTYRQAYRPMLAMQATPDALED